jgi:hypothetical protein
MDPLEVAMQEAAANAEALGLGLSLSTASPSSQSRLEGGVVGGPAAEGMAAPAGRPAGRAAGPAGPGAGLRSSLASTRSPAPAQPRLSFVAGRVEDKVAGVLQVRPMPRMRGWNHLAATVLQPAPLVLKRNRRCSPHAFVLRAGFEGITAGNRCGAEPATPWGAAACASRAVGMPCGQLHCADVGIPCRDDSQSIHAGHTAPWYDAISMYPFALLDRSISWHAIVKWQSMSGQPPRLHDAILSCC